METQIVNTIILTGKMEGIALKHDNLAEYKIRASKEVLSEGYFYFTFDAPRGLFELDDAVCITVAREEKQKEEHGNGNG